MSKSISHWLNNDTFAGADLEVLVYPDRVTGWVRDVAQAVAAVMIHRVGDVHEA